jgi:hypothetical protein
MKLRKSIHQVGINALRSSYVSYRNSEAIKNGKQLSVKDKEKIAIIRIQLEGLKVDKDKN